MSQDPKLTPPAQPGGYPPPPPGAYPPAGMYPPPAQQEPPKKKRTGLKITVMVLAGFLLVIVVAAITGGNQPTFPTAPATPAGGATTGQQPVSNPPATTAAPAVHTVEYRITGEGGATHASITYSDGGASISQEQGAALPWTKTFDVPKGRFSVASLSGQNAGSAGKVTCTIIVDGQTVKTGIGSGAYAIASCSGPIEGF